ncbi:MAG: SDR family oxidoreductase [Anaerolineae bacterium]|nr:SDR family oxidoreductase [Anaerolineae bacterium]
MTRQNNIALLSLGMLAGLALVGLVRKHWTKRPLPALNSKKGAALITGASSGIGAAYARRLAALGYDLILVARREERLNALAREVEHHYHLQAEVLVADLADSADVTKVEQRLRALDSLTILVNNAGFGTWRQFLEADLQTQLNIIAVNVGALVRLTHAALPGMTARGTGAVINVSSIAPHFHAISNVVYGATKSYVTTFSKTLGAELASTGVRVQALCPGFTVTEFHDTPEFEAFDRRDIPKFLWMTAEDVVEESLQALKTDQVVVVPGLQNRLLVGAMKTPGLNQLLLKIINWQIRTQNWMLTPPLNFVYDFLPYRFAGLRKEKSKPA